MRLINMDSHFAPIDEFAYVPGDLRHLTPAWLPLEREDISQEAKECIGYQNALEFLGGRVR